MHWRTIDYTYIAEIKIEHVYSDMILYVPGPKQIFRSPQMLIYADQRKNDVADIILKNFSLKKRNWYLTNLRLCFLFADF